MESGKRFGTAGTARSVQSISSRNEFTYVTNELQRHGIIDNLTFDRDRPEYLLPDTTDGKMQGYAVVAEVVGGPHDGERFGFAPGNIVAPVSPADWGDSYFFYLSVLLDIVQNAAEGKLLSEVSLPQRRTFVHKQTGMTMAVVLAARFVLPVAY